MNNPDHFILLFLGIRDGKKSDPWFDINIPDLTHCLFMSPQISPNLKYKIGDIFGSRIHGSKVHQITDPPLIHYHPWFIIMNPTSLLQNVRHRRSISNTSEWCDLKWSSTHGLCRRAACCCCCCLLPYWNPRSLVSIWTSYIIQDLLHTAQGFATSPVLPIIRWLNT